MADLPTNELGRTGMQVTRLGYGAMELRGASGRGGQSDRNRAVTPEQAEAVLNAVLDAGINFIDTSPDYGISEECGTRCNSPVWLHDETGSCLEQPFEEVA